jgi:hypothetical protein
MRVVAVSDVTLGYGTPQLPLLAECIAAHYRAEVKVIEPVQPELAPKHTQFPDFDIRRIATSDHPHSPTGRSEYIWRASKLVNSLNPDVLLICCTYCLPVIYRLSRRPRKVIYYSVESIPFYGEFDVEMNRRAAPLLDAIIFPEENRATFETARCGFAGVPKLVLYNVSNRRNAKQPVLDASQRNGRILYSGTINRSQTFADYYLSDKVRSLPIDLFGPVKGSTEDKNRFLTNVHGVIQYRGYISSVELAALRPSYLYSIVAWNPDVENQLYAAPNKFFESIADGVPPIAAPHPQCKLMIERYGCGMLMADWSFDSFLSSLRKAIADAGSERWQAMVDACAQAVDSELTWDAQFEKLKPYL